MLSTEKNKLNYISITEYLHEEYENAYLYADIITLIYCIKKLPNDLEEFVTSTYPLLFTTVSDLINPQLFLLKALDCSIVTYEEEVFEKLYDLKEHYKEKFYGYRNYMADSELNRFKSFDDWVFWKLCSTNNNVNDYQLYDKLIMNGSSHLYYQHEYGALEFVSGKRNRIEIAIYKGYQFNTNRIKAMDLIADFDEFFT